jgi:hypothetical protein
MIKYEVKNYNFDNLQKIEVNPKTLKDYDFVIDALKQNEIKKVIGKRDFIAKQGVKHLRQKLELEREFIPELKRYFKRQSLLIKNKSPNIISIEPYLRSHYMRVGETIIKHKVKQASNDDIVKRLIEEKARKQAGIIDVTTNEEIETSVEMARQQLSEEGNFSPSQAILYMIAAKIFLNRIRGRIQGIATTETQGMYEALRASLIENYNNELTDVIVMRDVEKAREIAEVTESYTNYRIAEQLEKPRADNRRLFALVALAMKMWVTMGDLKVRAWHQIAHGQTVAVTMVFVVMGEMLKYPGDPNGSAKNIVNCRCVVIYL